jgi:hypothetical protein
MKALLFVALLACKPSLNNDNPTKPGTVVLAWDVSKATHAEIAAAKLGEIKRYDLDFSTHLIDADKTLVKLKIHLETATMQLTGADREAHEFSVPTKLTVTAVDAGDYTLGPPKRGCIGPDFKLALPYPRDMILQCYLDADRPRHDLSIALVAFGDGTIVDDFQPAK